MFEFLSNLHIGWWFLAHTLIMVVCFTLLVLAWLFRDPKLFDGWGQYLDGVTNDGSKVKFLTT